MSRLTKYIEGTACIDGHESDGCCEVCETVDSCSQCPIGKIIDKLAHYEDLDEAGRLIDTHKAAVILAETFGYEHPCNFNRIDEWFPEACDCADLCPDGKMSAIACWEQYIKIKLAELKGGAE